MSEAPSLKTVDDVLVYLAREGIDHAAALRLVLEFILQGEGETAFADLLAYIDRSPG